MKIYLCLFAILLTQAASASSLKSDESVILFPAYGVPQANNSWQLQLHAWVFEPETDHFIHQQFVKLLSSALELTPDSPQQALFKRRVEPFLYDSESRKTFQVSVAGSVKTLGKTQANGHVYQNVWVNYSHSGTVNIAALKRDSASKAFLIPETGLSIISDIDDTIKISQVTDKKALLKNTFLEPFKAVPDMAKLYQHWHQQGAAFHYLSASPWQLYPALASFIHEAGFPDGTFHMRHIRIKDRTIWSLLTSPKDYKIAQIDKIVQDFPKRRFILVGDSGESDPEIYTTIALRYPENIDHIFIRQVTDKKPTRHPDLQVPFTVLPQ